uniref:Uncharacterized protein n=1 Tax=Streptomyces tsusimaensis TaxID=285482 RepID=Q1PSG6_9ACTN|nr:unknown [Streptomyces tsusimaensis]
MRLQRTRPVRVEFAALPEQPPGDDVSAPGGHPEPRFGGRQPLALLDQPAQLPHRLHVPGLHRLPQHPLRRLRPPLAPRVQGEHPQPPYGTGVPGGSGGGQRLRVRRAAVALGDQQQDTGDPHDPAQVDQRAAAQVHAGQAQHPARGQQEEPQSHSRPSHRSVRRSGRSAAGPAVHPPVGPARALSVAPGYGRHGLGFHRRTAYLGPSLR